MRGDFFDFCPSHLTVIASNHLPQVREGGPSFWRRVRLIPFQHVVPEQRRDADLHARILETEGPAVLGWAVRGAMIVLADGLADPDRVRAATEDYRISEDSLASFVRDECLLGDGHWCDVGALRHRYERHCVDMGCEPVSAKALTMRLTAEYGVEQGRLSRPSRRIYRRIGLLSPDGGPQAAMDADGDREDATRPDGAAGGPSDGDGGEVASSSPAAVSPSTRRGLTPSSTGSPSAATSSERSEGPCTP